MSREKKLDGIYEGSNGTTQHTHPPGREKKRKRRKEVTCVMRTTPSTENFLSLSCIIPPICNIQHVSDPVMSCALYMYALYTPLVGIQ